MQSKLRAEKRACAAHVTRVRQATCWELETLKQRAEALILGASRDTLSRRAVLPPEQWTEHLVEYLGQARAGGLAGVSTGLHDLDRMTLGLSPGLYLLAASTGNHGTVAAADPNNTVKESNESNNSIPRFPTQVV